MSALTSFYEKLKGIQLRSKFEDLSFDRAIMMGLMLHTNAKQLIQRQNYKDALEVLTMGEVSFCLKLGIIF